MISFPIDTQCIEALYQNGDITPRGLAAIAPVKWLAKHHPELLNTSEKATSAHSAITLTCQTCNKFSQQRGMCTELDHVKGGVCREVTPSTKACDRYEASLPRFSKNNGLN